MEDGTIKSSQVVSEVLKEMPAPSCEYVFIAPEEKEKAKRWLSESIERLLDMIPSDASEKPEE